MKQITQKETDIIWSKVWNASKKSDPKNLGGGRLFIEAYPVFKKFINLNKGNTVLEIGSGTGRYGVKIAQDYPGCKVIITDIVEESLDVGRKLAEYVEINNISFQKEDVLNISFADNFFDLVFCDGVIQHLHDINLAVKEMKRVLKPGGKIIISSVNYWNPHSLYKLFLKLKGKEYEYMYEKAFSRRELQRLFLNNDLKIIGEDGFYCAYGIYRLKFFYNKIFGVIGRAANRIIVKFIDPLTNRYLSRHFGFEIFIVGRKKY